MKYRIATRLTHHAVGQHLLYLVQQRCCLFFWETIEETPHQNDAKILYFSLVNLEKEDRRPKLDDYDPPGMGYQPKNDKRPIPSMCVPPTIE